MPGRYDRFDTANVICVTLGNSLRKIPELQSVAAAPIRGQQIGQMDA
jgi:hypothetical protein